MNKTFLADGGTIWEVYEGDQDERTVGQTTAETELIVNQQVRLHQPVYILVDARRLGRHTLGARRVSARAMRRWPYDKIAIVGNSTYLRHMVNLIARATGHQHNVHYFSDEAAAQTWLGS